MRAALAEAKTVMDSAANEKLAKAGEGAHRRRGRDDLAAAIILAIAEGSRRKPSGASAPVAVSRAARSLARYESRQLEFSHG